MRATGLGVDLRGKIDVVVEEDLDGDAGDGLGAGVLDVAVDVGVLAAGDVFGLAHGELGDGERGGVVGQGLEGVGRRRGGLVRGKDKDADDQQDDEAGYEPGDDGSAAALRRRGEEAGGFGGFLLG